MLVLKILRDKKNKCKSEPSCQFFTLSPGENKSRKPPQKFFLGLNSTSFTQKKIYADFLCQRAIFQLVF